MDQHYALNQSEVKVATPDHTGQWGKPDLLVKAKPIAWFLRLLRITTELYLDYKIFTGAWLVIKSKHYNTLINWNSI